MKNCLTILGLFLLTTALFSEPIEITEEKAVELALLNNSSLERQRINELNAELDRGSAYNVLYPSIKATHAVANLNTPPTAPVPEVGPTGLTFVEQEFPSTNLSLGFETTLILTPAISDGIKLLHSNAHLESLKTVQEERKVIKDTKKSFYAIFLLKEQISVYESNLTALENRYNQVSKNFKAGYVDELTLLEVEVALESLKPKIYKLHQAYELSIKNFNMILGLDINSDIELIGEITQEELETTKTEIFDTALLNNSNLNITNQNIKLLDEQINLKKSAAFYPVLGVSYSMKTTLSDPLNTEQWDLENFTDDSGAFTVFLSMDFAPLLPNSKQRVEIKKLENSRKAAEIGLNELKDGIDLQITKILQTLENSLQLQESLKANIDLAQRKLDLTNLAYRQGNKELLEVETAENDLRKAKLDLLNEEYNYLISLFELEELTGE